MKKRSYQFDYVLALAVSFLLILGVLILASISANLSQEKFGKTTHYLFHQLIFGLGPGIILGFLVFRTPLEFFRKWAGVFILANLVLMVLVFIPGLGVVSGGAVRWLNFGFFTFQPSEALKLTFLLYLSAWLASRRNKTKDKKPKKEWKLTLAPFLLILGVIVLLLTLQSDVSTLGVIVLVSILLYFSTNTPFWHVLLISLLGGGAFLILIKTASYRMQRVLVFFDPKIDPMGISYQIKQALIAIGSGGIFGLGLGMSQQKLGFLPQTMSDSIFAIFAEEAGFVGSLVLISLFLLFLWRGFMIAKNIKKDKFSRLLALGITSWICLQAFINIGAMIRILPLTGIPLPFISYGGSHLTFELVAIGLLLNISKPAKK